MNQLEVTIFSDSGNQLPGLAGLGLVRRLSHWPIVFLCVWPFTPLRLDQCPPPITQQRDMGPAPFSYLLACELHLR